MKLRRLFAASNPARSAPVCAPDMIFIVGSSKP